MGENSGIEWTTHTFNPWVGCTKVSPACDHCYAEAWDKRFGGTRWGPHAPRKRTKTWGNPVRWNRKAAESGDRPRVFCASLADVFDNHKSILPEWRRDLWRLIRETPSLDWLLLTKRPQNIARLLPGDWGDGYPNVWLGTTAENQTEADRRIPHLLAAPARVRFLSMEPLLGPVDLRAIHCDEAAVHPAPPGPPGPSRLAWRINVLTGRRTHVSGLPEGSRHPRLDWVIAGGESGPKFRHADPAWFRSLRDQCAAAGVPFLFKQWEGRSQREIKALGRVLDGVVHDGYPA